MRGRVQDSVGPLLMVVVLLAALLQVSGWIVLIAASLLTMFALVEPLRTVNESGFAFEMRSPSWRTIASRFAGNAAAVASVYVVGLVAGRALIG